MTATFRYAQIPKVWGELRLVDLPPVEGTFPVDQVAGTRLSASGMTLLDTTAGHPLADLPRHGTRQGAAAGSRMVGAGPDGPVVAADRVRHPGNARVRSCPGAGRLAAAASARLAVRQPFTAVGSS